MISAKVIADSISPVGVRLTSIEIEAPRFILAEINTHRVFSRNFQSSRAIPTAKLIERARKEPVMPLAWGRNRPGMQATELLEKDKASAAEEAWRKAALLAAYQAETLVELGVHKQWAGRLVEPFITIKGLVTSTHWANFYALRRHRDAQLEIKALADAMSEAQEGSVPVVLQPGQWHLPYYEPERDRPAILDHLGLLWEAEQTILEYAQKLSVARCARISYAPFDGDGSIEKELDRYELLVGSQPMHASPAEHQATPDQRKSVGIRGWTNGWWHESEHGNFTGWIQYRKTLHNECIKD